MIQFKWCYFSNLSLSQLYDILALRAEVFVVEQQCVYQDLDYGDQKAIHLLGYENNDLVAYLRLFPESKEYAYLKFGRVVTSPSKRSNGYGKLLMRELINFCEQTFPQTEIRCSAQYYLKKFYETFGFQAHGEIYDEDGIEHIEMRK